MAQGKNQGGGQQQKKKKTDKATGKKKGRIALYFSSVRPTRKLRRMLRSNGPEFARKHGSASDLVRLAREQTKVGALARTALGR